MARAQHPVRFSAVLALALLIAGCGTTTNTTVVAPDGTACTAIGACFDNAAYSCVYDSNGTGRWVRERDCSQSPTAGCACQLHAGFAGCASSEGTCL